MKLLTLTLFIAALCAFAQAPTPQANAPQTAARKARFAAAQAAVAKVQGNVPAAPTEGEMNTDAEKQFFQALSIMRTQEVVVAQIQTQIAATPAGAQLSKENAALAELNKDAEAAFAHVCKSGSKPTFDGKKTLHCPPVQ
jgi:hypothetical protein